MAIKSGLTIFMSEINDDPVPPMPIGVSFRNFFNIEIVSIVRSVNVLRPCLWKDATNLSKYV